MTSAMHVARALTLYGLATSFGAGVAAPAGANVYARTFLGSVNNNLSQYSSSQIDGGDFGFADRVTDGGFAQATARSAPGALSGLAQVVMQTGPGLLSGSLDAFAQGSTFENIRIGDQFCTLSTCSSAAALGVTAIAYTIRIRASGGIFGFSSSNGPGALNVASSWIVYNWSFAGASGGGSKSINDDGVPNTGIGSQTVTVTVAPNSVQLLNLGFTTSASAGTILFPGWTRGGSASASALADFAHTLQWEGVQSVRAFGADGNEITLDPGGRFTLIGDSGMDFWDASPGFGAVPEPAAWALMIIGFGVIGGVARRRLRIASVTA